VERGTGPTRKTAKRHYLNTRVEELGLRHPLTSPGYFS
jgi:hypothetical protein